MRTLKTAFTLAVALLLINVVAHAAANIFFLKAYNEDFKKNRINTFFGGDPIYGLINVTGFTVNDDLVTSVEQFANGKGEVIITLYFQEGPQLVWRLPLAAGRVKNNRFLFCLLPESKEKLNDDYFWFLKILNSRKGQKVNVTVGIGEKGSTAWREDNIVIDLTGGLKTYGDWYSQLAPASIKSNNVYYPICISSPKPNSDLVRSELEVISLTSEGMKVNFSGTTTIVDKVAGYDFLMYQSGYADETFYVKQIDDQSFVFYQPNNKYSVYHTEKRMADETDMNKRCAADVIQKLGESVTKYRDVRQKEKYDSEKPMRVALTNHMRTLKSQRNDPDMEKKIKDWWNNRHPDFPAQKVLFLDPDYFLVRDEYNQVLRRLISTIVLYKSKTGVCFVQWNAFGYQHLGGGAFDSELTAWKAGYKQYENYIYKIPNMNLEASYDYELDTCN